MKAQKQTYKLIDTVKQLDSIIRTLAPTLEMGRKVIDKNEKVHVVKATYRML